MSLSSEIIHAPLKYRGTASATSSLGELPFQLDELSFKLKPALELTDTGYVDLIFRNLRAEEHIAMGIKEENWYARPASEVLGRDVCSHVAVSTFPMVNGKILRQDDKALRTFMLVCDDCGEEKVDKETGEIYRIKIPPLEPSFILQTSLQSTQWIYVFEDPLECVKHGDLIKRCWGALADAGYTQSIGELNRYVRVPGSRGYKFNKDGTPMEGKHGYVCRCIHAA